MIAIETYYLIDFENVHAEGLTGCQGLAKTDHIVIFFTQNAKNIDMSSISNHGSAELEMVEVPSGKQSADMHICSYMSYLAGKHGKNCNVVIVSKDTGYDNLIKFWKEKTGISASRAEQIKKKAQAKQPVQSASPSSAKTASSTDTKAKQDPFMQGITQVLINAGLRADVANTIAQVAKEQRHNKHILAEVHNALHERYTNYLNLYAIAKPVVSQYIAGQGTVNEKTAVNSEVQKALSKAGYPATTIGYVASSVAKYFGEQDKKQKTHAAIVAKYGQQQGVAIYNRIKQCI